MTSSELKLGNELAGRINEFKYRVNFFKKFFDEQERRISLTSKNINLTFEINGNIANELRDLLLKRTESELAALEEEFGNL